MVLHGTVSSATVFTKPVLHLCETQCKTATTGKFPCTQINSTKNDIKLLHNNAHKTTKFGQKINLHDI
jgi:hypothetical protein